MGNPESPGTPSATPRLKISRDLWTSVALLIWVFLLRMPAIFSPHEMNVDESQMLSQAMKYLVDPIPWRSVDGTSGGPFNSALLSLMLLLGFHPGYILLHAVAAVLAGLQVVLAQRTLLRLAPGKPVILGLIPMLLALGFTREPQFLFYSSELLPSLMLAAGFHAFVVWLQPRPERPPAADARLLFLSGLSLGAAPWCKLQALPVTGALGLAILVTLLNRKKWFVTPSLPVIDALAFVGGAVLPALLMLAVVAGGGALGDFWSSYILGNLSYAGPFQGTAFLFRLLELLDPPDLWPFLALLLAAGALRIYRLVKRQIPAAAGEPVLVGIAALFFLSALFAVVRPSRLFFHYAIFLLYPLTLLGSFPLLRSLPTPTAGPGSPFRRFRWIAGAIVGVVLAGHAGSRLLELRGRTPSPPDANEKIVAEILKIQKEHPIRGLAVWGWTPGVYVLTGLPPATRDAIGHFVISRGSMQSYFRKRFVDDLRRAAPDLFIDTVAPGAFMWEWTENDGYESEDALKRLIEEQYDLTLSLQLLERGKPVRIFMRRGTATPR